MARKKKRKETRQQVSWQNIDFYNIEKDDIVRFINSFETSKFISPPAIVNIGNEKESTEQYIAVEEMFTCDPYIWIYKRRLFQYQKWCKNNEALEQNQY